MNVSELTLLVLRIAFLLLIWIFVFVIIYALRGDLFGNRVRKLPDAPAQASAPFAPAPASAQNHGPAHTPRTAAPAPAPVTDPFDLAALGSHEPSGADAAIAAAAAAASLDLNTGGNSLAGLAHDRTGSHPTLPKAGAQTPDAAKPKATTTKATLFSASKLVVTGGPKAGTEYPLTAEPITIGRSSESGLVIRDDYTSTHHARLMLWNNEWMLQDLDSTNGTFLDGVRVKSPTQVPLDTVIKVGMTTFELRR